MFYTSYLNVMNNKSFIFFIKKPKFKENCVNRQNEILATLIKFSMDMKYG